MIKELIKNHKNLKVFENILREIEFNYLKIILLLI